MADQICKREATLTVAYLEVTHIREILGRYLGPGSLGSGDYHLYLANGDDGALVIRRRGGPTRVVSLHAIATSILEAAEAAGSGVADG